MTIDEARKIPVQGPQVGPQQGQGGFYAGLGRSASARLAPQAARTPAVRRSSGYNSIFVGSKGYLGTSGRGEGVGLLPGKRWAEYKLPRPVPVSGLPAPAPAATTPRTAATGSAPAKAARRRAPTSASPVRTPSGSCSAPPPFTTKASCSGTTRRASSPTIAKPISG